MLGEDGQIPPKWSQTPEFKTKRRFPFLIKTGLCWEVLEAKRPPRRPQDAPRGPQDDPRSPKMALRRPQALPDGPKTAQDAAKSFPKRPKRRPDAPRLIKIRPKWSQVGPHFGSILSRFGAQVGPIWGRFWGQFWGGLGRVLGSNLEGLCQRNLSEIQAKTLCYHSVIPAKP